MQEIPVLFGQKVECCGCTACYSICGQKAIQMLPDEEGFEYPVINRNRCIRCYKCVEVCFIRKMKKC